MGSLLLCCCGFGLMLVGAIYLTSEAIDRFVNRKNKVNRMSFKIDLGAKVTCKITGYTGTVIGRTEWLYACRRYSIQARELKDGKPVDSICCDEDQLEIVEEPAVKHVMKNTGGPTDSVSRGHTVSR
jgi:hypothetical protein